jgi:hypothetical protein
LCFRKFTESELARAVDQLDQTTEHSQQQHCIIRKHDFISIDRCHACQETAACFARKALRQSAASGAVAAKDVNVSSMSMWLAIRLANCRLRSCPTCLMTTIDR